MRQDEIDELEWLSEEESDSESEGDGQLYEHFRIEVDKGQEPVRIDK